MRVFVQSAWPGLLSWIVAAVSCLGLLANVCVALETEVIHISGSDTMQILTRLWAEEYMKDNPGLSIYVQGGGTASGVKDLIRQRTEICAASRPLRPREVQHLARRHNTVGLTFTVAKEALSVYVHPENPVKNLTLQQLKLIFTGEIRNWNLVGGLNAPIFVLTRSPNSGTYLYFRRHILNEEAYAPNARTLANTQAIVKTISESPYSIGYGGVAYGESFHCKVNGVAPSHETIINDTYPITRYLYLVTTNSPKGTTKDFIDWVLSPDGQSLVAHAGYVPLWSP
jgi:phosphate transport system substrate-binding protein